MPLKHNFNPFLKLQKRDEFPHFRYYSWWPFGKKKVEKSVSRPGALKPEELKKIVNEMGVGSVVEILRIGYDGNIDDLPVLIKITQISDENFSGKIVNVEKQMIEEGTEKIIFAKMGGGIIEFQFDDGDIKEINKSIDQSVVAESRDVSAQKEVLAALEIGDKIMMAYYDEKQHGSVNVEGTLLSKSPENTKFKIMIEKINRIEIEKKTEKEFDLEKDLVIDIDMV
jgi:hypothetical protein